MKGNYNKCAFNYLVLFRFVSELFGTNDATERKLVQSFRNGGKCELMLECLNKGLK